MIDRKLGGKQDYHGQKNKSHDSIWDTARSNKNGTLSS